MLSHFKLPVICSKGECIVLESVWKKGGRGRAERGQNLSAALGSAEVFIRQNNRQSLLAFVFFIMLFFVLWSISFSLFFLVALQASAG